MTPDRRETLAEGSRERPIIFRPEFVRKILSGEKTQTRRISTKRCCPYGAEGDRLWVRETWAQWAMYTEHHYNDADGYSRCSERWVDMTPSDFDDPGDGVSAPVGPVAYLADGQPPKIPDYRLGCWRPSIHMPRWACRLVLKVTGARLERLQEISEEDARAEGLALERAILPGHARNIFASRWDEINGIRAPWASNPWVWVVGFRRETAEDQKATLLASGQR